MEPNLLVDKRMTSSIDVTTNLLRTGSGGKRSRPTIEDLLGISVSDHKIARYETSTSSATSTSSSSSSTCIFTPTTQNGGITITRNSNPPVDLSTIPEPSLDFMVDTELFHTDLGDEECCFLTNSLNQSLTSSSSRNFSFYLPPIAPSSSPTLPLPIATPIPPPPQPVKSPTPLQLPQLSQLQHTHPHPHTPQSLPLQPTTPTQSSVDSPVKSKKRKISKTKEKAKKDTHKQVVPNTLNTIQNVAPSASTSQVQPLQVPVFLRSAFSNVNFHLRVNKQPPAQTVYQRILKPFPAVMLLGSESNDTYDLFVEASLLRSDSNAELPLCLDGTRIVRISPGQFTLFKRLKILSTTQQQGTLFRLKFQLKRYQEGGFVTIHGVHDISSPIEVFSHTYYLNNRGRGRNAPPPPPTVTEVLPHRGPATGGTRVVILGANFVDSNKLLVKFGDVVVGPQFHENKTLICTTLPGPPNTTVEVRVANDGVEYCDTLATFTYD